MQEYLYYDSGNVLCAPQCRNGTHLWVKSGMFPSAALAPVSGTAYNPSFDEAAKIAPASTPAAKAGKKLSARAPATRVQLRPVSADTYNPPVPMEAANMPPEIVK